MALHCSMCFTLVVCHNWFVFSYLWWFLDVHRPRHLFEKEKGQTLQNCKVCPRICWEKGAGKFSPAPCSLLLRVLCCFCICLKKKFLTIKVKCCGHFASEIDNCLLWLHPMTSSNICWVVNICGWISGARFWSNSLIVLMSCFRFTTI